MATSLFSPCYGAIVRVDPCANSGETGTTFNVTLDGNPIAFPVTGFILEMQGNYQFLHALDKFIYFYSFGDRVSELTVSGLAFAGRVCGLDEDDPAAADICSLYNLYKTKRQAISSKAINIGAGNCEPAFKGFLTGMRLEVSANAGGVPVGQWSLRFHVIPPRD